MIKVHLESGQRTKIIFFNNYVTLHQKNLCSYHLIDIFGVANN